ncbi:T9SS type A sorting domain-containing protein [Arenibacter sp. BSSL-BM3]|uniref:T9SS type A sorting domain-containing protein n=1 Tax=Arenibacter arenosicollis TaxID=2762274 RepID=A0ABR7QHC0_9FLAO|nr:T9SS type A sorting domain-containing protein [Arenibacter arenosicollis]MBC8766591.1 T9SS type A sorting domain-containing protein [Arenibacter arenosicollis]
MKIFYTLLFMVFSIAVSAQEFIEEPVDRTAQPNTFKLYPNPAYQEVVYITTKLNGVKDVVIYDVFGTIALQDRIKTSLLNISKLAPGVYVLQITENRITMTRKLVVK